MLHCTPLLQVSTSLQGNGKQDESRKLYPCQNDETRNLIILLMITNEYVPLINFGNLTSF